jgi:hypothetical protein
VRRLLRGSKVALHLMARGLMVDNKRGVRRSISRRSCELLYLCHI